MLPGAKGFNLNSYVNLNPSCISIFPAWKAFANRSHLVVWNDLIRDSTTLLGKNGLGSIAFAYRLGITVGGWQTEPCQRVAAAQEVSTPFVFRCIPLAVEPRGGNAADAGATGGRVMIVAAPRPG